MTQLKLKDTVFLPKTNFPMRGDLIRKEPIILEEWKKIGLFERLREKSKDREKFILHFGPPYANGHIHIGHALIGVLKDAMNKSYQMLGYDAPLVLGWDCHGLPIEWKVEEEYLKRGQKRDVVPTAEFLSECRSFAQKWMTIQKEEFEKLGIIADFDRPYNTMDCKSESIICQKFFEILKKGFVYQGKKPVMWSVVEKTALAEAELEYHDKVSDAIYVKFPIIETTLEFLKDAYAVIWTTTPWTIPANKAIAYSSSFTYAVIKIENEKYLVAKDLVDAFISDAKIEHYEIVGTIIGEELHGTVCEHPLRSIGYAVKVPLLPGSHVTIDAGVGLVHTAPAHGVEDFLLGEEFDLPIENIVNADGTLIDSLPCFAGLHVFKANQAIISELQKSGNLVHAYQIVHSYPHSWRSKAPLIFRTTSQWFISIGKIRDRLLAEIDKTQWFPNGYVNRIRSMVEKRPDWCISRQRSWGVPIALFIHKSTQEILMDDDVFDKIVQSMAEEGIETWNAHDNEYFLCGKYNPVDFEKVIDTLEVWFDSACSHHYVLEQRKQLSWPADLYFEGSDQHRGWFQSSLVESVCVNDKAPYKQVATNGFVLDKDGKKMSKSTGNVVAPGDVIEKYGVDILRLWCLTSDYSDDLRIGDEILKRQMDTYRKLRNTLRYLLGVLCDYDDGDDIYIRYSDCQDLEKFILHRMYKLNILMNECIQSCELYRFYTQLYNFCINDLSSFYFDIRKDSVYCDAKDDHKRKSCLFTMNKIFKHLVHWLAPLVSFTAEEAWKSYKQNKSELSIHLDDFPKVPTEWKKDCLETKWKTIKNVRGIITKALETERMAKTIGSSLEAEVIVYSANSEITKIISEIDIAEISIISKSTIVTAQPPSNATTDDGIPEIGVVVQNARGKKCDRCWRIGKEMKEVNDARFGNVVLCPRCISVLETI
jgi:isoleucyl-tRNA synthetase